MFNTMLAASSNAAVIMTIHPCSPYFLSLPTAAQKHAADSADTALRGLHKERLAVDLMNVWSHHDVLTIGLFPLVAGLY